MIELREFRQDISFRKMMPHEATSYNTNIILYVLFYHCTRNVANILLILSFPV